MEPRHGFLRAGLAGAALAVLLSACASTPKPAPAPAGPVAARLAPKARLDFIILLLQQGRSAEARVEILNLHRDKPATAKRLLDQIDMNPVLLLGERNYPYKLKPGETLSGLADRFLGDPLLFYALARYNDISVPQTAAAGLVLKIPGTPKKPAPAKPAKAVEGPGKPAAPTSAGPARDPARATQLRGAALQDMNSGAIDRAVGRLRQALTFDPDNALIKRDLDRALRILATVRAR